MILDSKGLWEESKKAAVTITVQRFSGWSKRRAVTGTPIKVLELGQTACARQRSTSPLYDAGFGTCRTIQNYPKL